MLKAEITKIAKPKKVFTYDEAKSTNGLFIKVGSEDSTDRFVVCCGVMFMIGRSDIHKCDDHIWANAKFYLADEKLTVTFSN